MREETAGADSTPHPPSPPLLEPPVATHVFLRHPCVLLICPCFSLVALSVCYLQQKSLNVQGFTNICRQLELERTVSPSLCLPIGDIVAQRGQVAYLRQ